MRCFPTSDPFQNVPLALRSRHADELNRSGEENFGIKLTGGDAYSVYADLTGTTRERFLAWCASLNICRCDVDRSSDITIFLGRSPLVLQMIEAWQEQPNFQLSLCNLLPDEVFTRLQEASQEVLEASNERVATLRGAADAGIYAAQEELDQLERTAVAVLETHGFKVPKTSADEDPLGPPPPSDMPEERRRELAKQWGSLSGVADDTEVDGFGMPTNWEGF